MTDISSNTKNFLKKSIERGLREDGRGLLELRGIQIIFNFEEDGVEVSLGETRVYAKIKSEIVEPRLEGPNEGFLRFKPNLQILAERGMDNSRQKSSILATEIGKILERSIKGSKYFFFLKPKKGF